MLKYIKNFLNGVAFGIVETVPGVSGGTIAIILGFYGELIESINHFTHDIKKYLRFLVPLLLGMVAGLVGFSRLVKYLLDYHSFPTMSFFIGLIVGIIPLIFVRAREPGKPFKPSIGQIFLIIVPLALLVTISHLREPADTNTAEIIKNIDLPFMLFILLGGIVAAAALIIPGISGSFVLLLLGIYPIVNSALSSITSLITDISNTSIWMDIAKVLLPLGIGIVIGGLTMARIIQRLLKDHTVVVYSIILGLLTGSVYALFRNPMVMKSGVSTWIIITGILTFCLGSVISYSIGKRKL